MRNSTVPRPHDELVVALKTAGGIQSGCPGVGCRRAGNPQGQLGEPVRKPGTAGALQVRSAVSGRQANGVDGTSRQGCPLGENKGS